MSVRSHATVNNKQQWRMYENERMNTAEWTKKNWHWHYYHYYFCCVYDCCFLVVSYCVSKCCCCMLFSSSRLFATVSSHSRAYKHTQWASSLLSGSSQNSFFLLIAVVFVVFAIFALLPFCCCFAAAVCVCVCFCLGSHLIKCVQPICLLARTTIINCDWSATFPVVAGARAIDACEDDENGQEDVLFTFLAPRERCSQHRRAAVYCFAFVVCFALIPTKWTAHLIFQIARSFVINLWSSARFKDSTKHRDLLNLPRSLMLTALTGLCMNAFARVCACVQFRTLGFAVSLTIFISLSLVQHTLCVHVMRWMRRNR